MREELLTVHDIAKWFGRSERWVRDHAAGRRRPYIPCIKMGSRDFRFKESEIEEWLGTLKKKYAHVM